MPMVNRNGTVGFVYVGSPGYDQGAVTGQAASGATLTVVSTGCGSCFGARPAPRNKLASNSDLARRGPEAIDIDRGVVIEQDVSLSLTIGAMPQGALRGHRPGHHARGIKHWERKAGNQTPGPGRTARDCDRGTTPSVKAAFPCNIGVA
ncbi:D-galactarate dehydratase/altronate hydrolase [Salipiger aestuarii]|uniref:D-galactarate dehydratase/altronate hydrolase n=1 Tax=Salipiger aestuarii TaxID=568098 RepID=A0A327YEP6_9RHOB|nr:UxaA family hydrolase [Salipiger aestuarii]RAK16969.1 D-galactarate dehydratase/altronate hydrolase [Salipiger aestuarii]